MLCSTQFSRKLRKGAEQKRAEKVKPPPTDLQVLRITGKRELGTIVAK